MEAINSYFNKSQEQQKSEVDRQIDKLTLEIESLEEHVSEHQGFKFYKAAMTRDVFEDALTELREKQFDQKFTAEKE